MTGAIFYSGQYGSTAQYAQWISDATDLPIFDVTDNPPDPSAFDFVIMGSSVIIYKLTIRHWVIKHLDELLDRPICLFSVSGAPSGPKLDGWIRGCLPSELVEHMRHVALRGRLDIQKLGWWARLILRIGAWKNDDPDARKEELRGFDYMDKCSVEPIIQWVRKTDKPAVETAFSAKADASEDTRS